MDERIARLAEEESVRQIGSETFVRLRTEGSRMRVALALARVQETLHRQIPDTKNEGDPVAETSAVAS